MLERIKLAVNIVALINGAIEPRYNEADVPYSVYNVISLLSDSVKPHISFSWYETFENVPSVDELITQICAKCIYKGDNAYIQKLLIKACEKTITLLNREDSPRMTMSNLMNMFPGISSSEDEIILSKRIPELVNVYTAWFKSFSFYYNIDKLDLVDGCMEIKFKPTFNRELEKSFNSIFDITFKEIEKFIQKHTTNLIIKRKDSFAIIIPLY